VPRLFVDIPDPVFDLVADEAMLDRRTVRDQAAVLIEQALGLRSRQSQTPSATRDPGQPLPHLLAGESTL
jgi:hypothetical protein